MLVILRALAITFILPWSTAATIRIQTLLKAESPKEASVVAWNCVVYGSIIIVLVSISIMSFRYNMGYIFSNNQDIVFRTENMSLYASLFCIPYGFQIIFKGVLRAGHYHWDMLA